MNRRVLQKAEPLETRVLKRALDQAIAERNRYRAVVEAARAVRDLQANRHLLQEEYANAWQALRAALDEVLL